MKKKSFIGFDGHCPFCNIPPANADPWAVKFIKLSDPTEQKVIHIFCGIAGTGLKISLEQKEYFDKIFVGKMLDPLYLSDKQIKNLNGYIKSLLILGSHQETARMDRSKIIFDWIICLNNNRISEETIKETLLLQNIEKEPLKYFDQKGGGLRIAAVVQ